jgi:hypothetical protein
MCAINRSAVIVMPAQPFLDWLHRADETSGEVSLAELRQDPTIYLLPEYDSEEETGRHLRKFCCEIFEEQLDGWYRVPSAWPSDRSFRVFKQWFDFHFHSVLFDLCPGPVIKEAAE